MPLDHTVSKLLANIQDEDEKIQEVSLRHDGEDGEAVSGDTKLKEIATGAKNLSLLLNNIPFSLKVSTQKPKETVSFSVKALEKQATFSTIARHLRDTPGNKMSHREYLNMVAQVYGLSVEEGTQLLQQLMNSGLIIYLPSVCYMLYYIV